MDAIRISSFWLKLALFRFFLEAGVFRAGALQAVGAEEPDCYTTLFSLHNIMGLRLPKSFMHV